MPHADIEDQLVEQPAIGLFAELGWSTVSALEATFGAPSPGLAANPVTLTRPSTALSRPTGEGQLASTSAVDELTRDRAAMSLLSGQVALSFPAAPVSSKE
ncbi:MAG: hypothetical protein ABSC03_15790 [Verrucomicrobiota bacterium]|jgi:type I restriction enzyme R subunit